jgi:hypothetical protein
LFATNVLDRKSRVFWYVLNSCIDVSLFNSSQISIRFRIVVYQLSDVRVVFRVDEISTKTFMKKRTILQFFWLFEIASEMIEKMLTRSTKKRYELMKRNCFLWKISRTRFAFLSNERFLKCMIWIWILKRNN